MAFRAIFGTLAAVPFFIAPAPATRIERRLLLVSHSFAPLLDVGALRWRKLGEIALERGWALDVIMELPELAALDPAELAKAPAGARLYGVPLREPAISRARRALQRTLVRHSSQRPLDARSRQRPSEPWHRSSRVVAAIRGALYYSAHRRWAAEAAALANAILTAEHAAVVSSGPPHMAHYAGALIAREAGLPFFMDMRDPWSLGNRASRELESPLWWTLSRYFERQALAAASVVIANTEPSRLAMCRHYPSLAQRTITVMNGSDDEPLPPRRTGARFVVAYAGSLYWDRDPRPLFRAAAIATRRLRLRPHQFSIELMGEVMRVEAGAVDELARSEGVADYVTLLPGTTRQRTMEFLARADMLVSLSAHISGGNEGQADLAIPAKIFEYVRFDAWLLAICDAESATAQLLRDTTADIVAPHDVEGIADVFVRRYLEWQNGVVPRAIDDGRFSRRAQALRLFDALEAHAGAGVESARPLLQAAPIG